MTLFDSQRPPQFQAFTDYRVGASEATPNQLSPEFREQITERFFGAKAAEQERARVQAEGLPFVHSLIASAPAVGVDFLDTVISSMTPLNLVERGDLWDYVGTMGWPGRKLEEYYDANQGLVETTSGVVGAVGVGYVTGVKGVALLSTRLASSGAVSGSRLWQLGTQADAAARAAVQARNLQAARQGGMYQAWRSAEAWRYSGIQIAKVTGIIALEEAAILATMNTHDLIWDPEDMASNLFWSGFVPGALGVGLGAFQARRGLRGMANDPLVTTTRAIAQDQIGITRQVEGSRLPTGADMPLTLLRNQPAPAASVTRYALNAHQALPVGDTALTSVVDATRGGELKNLSLGLNKLGFDDAQTKYWQTTVLRDDPLTLHAMREVYPKKGAERIEQLEHELKIVKKLHAGTPPGTKQDGFFNTIKKIEGRLARVAIHLHGTWFSRAEGEQFLEAVEAVPRIKPDKTAGAGVFNVQISSGRIANVSESGITVTGDIAKPLTVVDRLALADTLESLSDSLLRRKQAFQVLSSGKPSWLLYDAAIRHAARGGKVTLPKGIGSLDELEVESLKLKAEEIFAKPADSRLKTAMDHVMFNLPTPTYMERVAPDLGDVTLRMLEAARRGAGAVEIRELRDNLQKIQGYAKQSTEPTQLTGALFSARKALRDPAQTPVYAIMDEGGFAQQDRILDAVAERLVEDRHAALSFLVAPVAQGRSDSFVRNLAMSIMQGPDFQKASQVHGLADNQMTGSGGFFSQLAGETRTAEFRARDNDTMLALIQTVELMARQTDNFTRELVRNTMGDSTKALSGPGGKVSRQLLNAFHTFARGWDLETTTKLGEQQGRDLHGFILKPTKANADRLNTTVEDMQRALDAEAPFLLQNPRTKQPLTLDPDALEWQVRFNSMSTQLLQETNRIRQALRLRPLAQRPWYIPPPPTEGKLVGFAFDANDNIIPGKSIIADTQGEFNRQKLLLEQELGGAARIRTREQVAVYKDAIDDALLDWMDPTRISSPSRQQAGGLGTATIQQNSIQDSMAWVQGRAESVGRGTLRALLDEQIRSARLRHSADVTLSGGNITKRTIYQEYEAIARGIPLNTLESSITGSIARAFTAQGQRLIDAVWPAVEHFTPRMAARYVRDLTQRMGMPDRLTNQALGQGATFSSISKALGPYSPYRNFEDFLSQTQGLKPPPQLRAISQKMNALSGALMLRYAETQHAAMNIIGLMTTMPAIVRSGRAPVTSFGKGNAISVLDTARILAGAQSDMLRSASKADWDMMLRNGDASQQVVDFNLTWSLIEDRSAFGRIFYGTGVSNPRTKTAAGRIFEERGIDGLISIATDSTENFSRAYSHFVGLRMARLAGYTDMDSAHQFAREIANAGIANYSIVNRPEAYQSAFGALLGLFTSWSRSYNQRMFRWMEEGEYQRIAEQFAIQTALFGVTSNTGVDALSGLFQMAVGERDDKGQEVPTLVDRIYARLGPEAGAVVAYGGIAELTGLALWTRGDVNIRQPTLNPFQAAPALGLLRNVGRIVRDISVSGADPQLLSESLSRNFPNRVAKGLWTELVEGGTETDAAGRVVAESQSFVDSIARMTGIRSARQQMQVEAYFANATAIRNDALRLAPLRQKTRSLLRKNQLTPEIFATLFDDYVKAGGSPMNFQSWIQSQVRESVSPRDVRQLQRALNNPQNQLRVWRHDSMVRQF